MSEPAWNYAKLEELVTPYLGSYQLRRVRAAYLFSEKAHAGQRRLDGNPFIQHPLEVSRILGGMRMDHQTISAAILHDVIEDTDITKEQIQRKFGREIAELVDGVTKLDQLTFDNHEEAQASNLRKMFLSMTHDIRVIIVKLADRLHNMRTLGALPAAKRRRIAKETLEIYAPIAERLGMDNMRLELESLGFLCLYPTRHNVLQKNREKLQGNRRALINRLCKSIESQLEQDGLEAHVYGREKNLYSIYRKMKRKRISFQKISDIYAFRIIVNSVSDCYLTLGGVHGVHKPVPGTFKDYIAIPKTNGYQSLHTTLFGPAGIRVEIQIRTREMERVAEAGIAAHWLYKSGGAKANVQAHRSTNRWFREILELQQKTVEPEEFLEHVKIDLFPEEVYVFTPKGDIMKLPRGATVVDMAYAIHTDVGNRCVEARIDLSPVPLSTKLGSGQTVEIITSPLSQPNPQWLNFVATARARTNIRHYLGNLQLSEARQLGEKLLGTELKAQGVPYQRLSHRQIQSVLEQRGLKSESHLLEEIGLGNLLALPIAKQLLMQNAEELPSHARSPQTTPLVITGSEEMVVDYAKCCHPIPGDHIIAYISAGRGIVIHREHCSNVTAHRRSPEKWNYAEWATNLDREFTAGLRMYSANKRGNLALAATAIADQKANILDVQIIDDWDRNIILDFKIEVHDRQHLAHVIHRLRRISQMSAIKRA